MKKRSIKKYNNNWPLVAICYDFDKTLSPKDMQEFSLIPKLNCLSNEFWEESNGLAKREGMDKILAYMRTIIQKAENHISIKESDFKKLGKDIELFPGVDTWFERINAIAERAQVNVEHYIISAGLREIIQGTSIAKYFEEVYASSFLYDTYGKPMWPRQVVNYTTKTQYLFRISKDCLDLGDEDSVNEFLEYDERRIPFSNFIYIGDSETDIPAMKIVKNGGGISIGVYNPQTRNIDRVRKLLKQGRIDYLMPADYSENSLIEKLVVDALHKIRESYWLTILNRRQNEYISELEYLEGYADGYIEYLENYYSDGGLESISEMNGELDDEGVKYVQEQVRKRSKSMRRDLHIKYDDIVPAESINEFMDTIDYKMKEAIADKKQKNSRNHTK